MSAKDITHTVRMENERSKVMSEVIDVNDDYEHGEELNREA